MKTDSFAPEWRELPATMDVSKFFGKMTSVEPVSEEEEEACLCAACDEPDGTHWTSARGGMWYCDACWVDVPDEEKEDDGYEDCEWCGHTHHHEDKCPKEDESEDEEETPEVTLFSLIQAWLSANATEWSGKTARDIAGAIGYSKHEVNKTLYANKEFIQMTVAGQSAPAWRCA